MTELINYFRSQALFLDPDSYYFICYTISYDHKSLIVTVGGGSWAHHGKTDLFTGDIL